MGSIRYASCHLSNFERVPWWSTNEKCCNIITINHLFLCGSLPPIVHLILTQKSRCSLIDWSISWYATSWICDWTYVRIINKLWIALGTTQYVKLFQLARCLIIVLNLQMLHRSLPMTLGQNHFCSLNMRQNLSIIYYHSISHFQNE